jgi:hypothetical protein
LTNAVRARLRGHVEVRRARDIGSQKRSAPLASRVTAVSARPPANGDSQARSRPAEFPCGTHFTAASPTWAGAALLLADAWFDVCTSPPGLDRLLAVGEAVLVELPLAAAAIWLAVALTRGTGRRRPS